MDAVLVSEEENYFDCSYYFLKSLEKIIQFKLI